MTRLAFKVLCGVLTINPDIALENPNVRRALADRDDKQVKHLLETEF